MKKKQSKLKKIDNKTSKKYQKLIKNLLKIIPDKKKLKHFQKEIKSFFKKAFTFQNNSAFIGLSLTFLLLSGSNYYLDLQLKPKGPTLREVKINLPPPSSYPVQKANIPPPIISARSAIVVDNQSSVLLYEKNSSEPLLPASTTKIMTALVALKHYPLDYVITVKLADRSIGQTMNLIKGEKMTVENLLYGLLMHSGNDAAYALAENFEGGYNAFVEEMNNLAKKYHLENTHFQNVSGIDQIGHYTTVSDLARLSSVAMKNKMFKKMVSTQEKTITDVESEITHELVNINQLLGLIEGLRGVKTGWTQQAGECLVTNTIRNDHEITTVILGSKDRFGESKTLIDWAYEAHEWVDPFSE